MDLAERERDLKCRLENRAFPLTVSPSFCNGIEFLRLFESRREDLVKVSAGTFSGGTVQ